MPNLEPINDWAEASRQGKVCGILGCRVVPHIKCPHCGNYYCKVHQWVMSSGGHVHIADPTCPEAYQKPHYDPVALLESPNFCQFDGNLCLLDRNLECEYLEKVKEEERDV